MRYYFAPMEGITTALYRNLHHRFFPGMDQYYTPFLSPARDHVFSKRDLQEILPEHQEGVPHISTTPGPVFTHHGKSYTAAIQNQNFLFTACAEM